MYIICVTVIVLISLIFLFWSGREMHANVEFLSKYGWKVSEKEIEIEEIKIPEIFDSVYDEYNKLQREAGLDLEKYKGKKAVRYTYTVLNYPIKTKEPVRANVICADKKPIAGDIMTVSFDGFMHSLNYPQ